MTSENAMTMQITLACHLPYLRLPKKIINIFGVDDNVYYEEDDEYNDDNNDDDNDGDDGEAGA